MDLIIISLGVLAFLGLINSFYLVWKKYKKQPLACPIYDDCNVVVESKWSKTFGIRNDLLGFVYFIIFLILLGLLAGEETHFIKQVLFWSGGVAFLFSLYLVYVQKYILRQYCFYCLISALINVLIFVFEIKLVY